MRIQRMALFLVLGAVLIGCDKDPVDPQNSAVVPADPTFAVTQNEWFRDMPFSFFVCDEWLDATLRWKILMSSTEAASGNVNWKFYVNIHGTAVGRTTGYDFVWNDAYNLAHETTAADGTPYTFHHYDNWVIIGKGNAPNYKYKATIHVTVNANGAVTVDFLKENTNCDDLLP